MQKKFYKNNYLKKCIVILFLLFCEYFFFRNVIGNSALIGDRGDGRLTMLLTEHWWQFICGNESFTELAMFYPEKSVIGYTDLLLGYGIVYCGFRFFHLNMYISYKLTLITIHLLGTISMYYLLKKTLQLSTVWSVFGTMAFSFSDTFARHMLHTQLVAISALPIFLILFIGFWNSYNSQRRKLSNIYAYACVTWFVLITYNSWYIAYFTGLFCFIFLIVYFISLELNHIRAIKLLIFHFNRNWIDILGCLVYMIILYIPFMMIYIPALQTSSGYSFDAIKAYMPEVIDLINVGEANLLMGKLISKMQLAQRGFSMEITEGFSIVLLVAFVAIWIKEIRNKHKVLAENDNTDKLKTLLIGSIITTILICMFSVIRLSSNGISIWKLIWDIIPMSKSVRAIARFWLWLTFPLSVITAYCGNKHYSYHDSYKGRFALLIILFMLFVSNVDINGVGQGWDEKEELKFITSVTPPPQDADTFYIIDTAQTQDPEYIYQLDAFEIATWYHLKTLNGYSGQFPPGWWGLWNPCTDAYENNVLKWIDNCDTQSVYAYDRASNTWIPFQQRLENIHADVFCPAENQFSICSGLQNNDQGEYCWTDTAFEVYVKNPNIQKTGLNIKLLSEYSWYKTQNPDIEPQISLYIDDYYVQDLPVIDGVATYNIPMNSHESDEYDIRIVTNTFFIPKDIGLNEDTRSLCVGIYYIGN